MYFKLDQRRQATPRTVEVYGGSSLGLNLSQQVCQLHGGEVGLGSKAGDGSTFGQGWAESR
jgi:two-component system sensor histidine kinase/response regulator